MDGPRVSCLVVSQPGRLDMLPVAVKAWQEQSWPSRELVIAWPGGPGDDEALLDRLGLAGRSDVRVVLDDIARPLGARRNGTIDAATGDLLVQWDDDDLFHPDRLTRQVEHLQATGARASLLGDVLVERVQTGQVFWADLSSAGAEPGRMLHATVMMRRGVAERYPEEGPHARIGEDTALLFRLLRGGGVAVLRGEPWLHVYRYHGKNTVSALHVARLAATTAAPPRESLRAGLEALVRVFGGPGYGRLEPPDAAWTWYGEVLDAQDPALPEARCHRAWERVRAGDLDGARRILEDLARDGAIDLPSTLTLAALYRADGRLGAARPLLGPPLERFPDHPPALAALGALALAEGRPAEAVRCFDRACLLAPWDASLASDRAVALAGAGRVDEAVAALRRLLDADPRRVAAHDNLLALLGRSRARLRIYKDLAARHPDVPVVLERYAAVLDDLGQGPRAREVAARARALRVSG